MLYIYVTIRNPLLKKTCPQNSRSSVIFSFKVWKNLTLEFKEKECNLSLLDGQEGGGRLFEGDRRVRYSVLVPNPISCPTGKKKPKKQGYLLHGHRWKKFPERCGERQGNPLPRPAGRPVNRSHVWSPALNSAVKSRPAAATVFMSHVGVSPKLPGGSSRFLLPLAGSRVVRVFSSAGTQRELLFILFL